MEQHDLTQPVSAVLSAVIPNKWRPNRLRPEQGIAAERESSGAGTSERRGTDTSERRRETRGTRRDSCRTARALRDAAEPRMALRDTDLTEAGTPEKH